MWYLVVRFSGLILALLLIVFGALNHYKQKEALLETDNKKELQDLTRRLWIWIGFITTAQFANIIESLVFMSNKALKCQFSTNVSNSI